MTYSDLSDLRYGVGADAGCRGLRPPLRRDHADPRTQRHLLPVGGHFGHLGHLRGRGSSQLLHEGPAGRRGKECNSDSVESIHVNIHCLRPVCNVVNNWCLLVHC